MKLMKVVFVFIMVIVPSICYAEMVIGTSTYSKDIDGDGHPEKFLFKLSMNIKEGCFEDYMKIWRDSSKTKPEKVFWEEKNPMEYGEMSSLLSLEGDVTLCQWINKLFTGNLVYGVIFRFYVITPDMVDSELVAEYANKHKLSTKQIEAMLYDNKQKMVIRYSATWSEGVVKLVYIPQLDDLVYISGDI